MPETTAPGPDAGRHDHSAGWQQCPLCRRDPDPLTPDERGAVARVRDADAWRVEDGPFRVWIDDTDRVTILALVARLEKRLAEVEAERDEWKTHAESNLSGWQLAHDKRECGHPRACWQDKNWPASEQNYDPETRTSDPPSDYRCLMCELESQLAAAYAAGPVPEDVRAAAERVVETLKNRRDGDVGWLSRVYEWKYEKKFDRHSDMEKVSEWVASLSPPEAGRGPDA
jgi:hypothetical protein